MPDLPEHEPNQILAMIKQGVTEQDARHAVSAAGGSVLKTTSNGRLTAVLIETKNIEDTIKHLENSDCFESVQLNYRSTHR